MDIIILSGGANKGIAQLGVLNYFEERKLISNVTEYYGASIGSVICLLKICGFTSFEIFTEICSKKIKLVDESHTIKDVFNNMSLFSIDPFMNMVSSMIMKKLGFIPTFEKLYDLTEITLTVVVTNITKGRPEYFSWKTKPRLSVLEAVKISCSLPFFFPRVSYENDYYLDGGLSDNFPIRKADLTKNILGVVSTDASMVGNDLYNYVYNLCLIPINSLTKIKADIHLKNVKIIHLDFTKPTFLEEMTESEKLDLFYQGYLEGEIGYKSFYLEL